MWRGKRKEEEAKFFFYLSRREKSLCVCEDDEPLERSTRFLFLL